MSMLSTTIFRHFCCILALLLTLVLQVAAYGQTVVHVDGDNGLAVPNLPDPGDSWDNAFKYLNDAIAFAKVNPGAEDLWVAATDVSNPYVPDRDAAFPNGTGDRSATFLLDFNNVQVLGGFFGNEIDPDDRNPAVYITVLSGGIFSGECGDPLAGDCFEVNGSPSCDDLCGGAECPGCCEAVCDQDPICCILPWDETCVAIAIGTCSPPPLSGDPSKAYHVVTANGVDGSVRIDGFTITDGLADGAGNNGVGAGMFISNASPAVVRIIFTENAAPAHGGGAMNVTGTSDPLVVNCEFIQNTGKEAGALHTEGGFAGGTFVNCLFSKNTSVEEGGAINPGANGNLNFINCTFVDNSVDNADGGGAIFTDTSQNGEVNLINCILWGNVAGEDPNQQPSQIDDPADVVSVTYSCVEGTLDPGWDDGDNINDDPLFVDAPNGDYRLDSLSPCIDFGDPDQSVIPPDTFDIDNDDDTFEPTPDLDLNNRVLDGDQIDGDRVDMGAYEFIHPDICPWDLNDDCMVGAFELLALLAAWGSDPGGPPDFDDDGIVGASDLLILLANWGACPQCSVEPPSLADELADACLSDDNWDAFVAKMTDPNASQADKDRYLCWMTHYLFHCNKCNCTHPSECPNPDPFNK